MSIHPNAYSMGLGAATVLIGLVGVVAWRNRDRPGSRSFLVLMAGVGLWAAGNAVQLAATDLGTKVAFRTLAYVGHNVVPISLLVFAAIYTGHGEWFTRRRIALLALEPMVVGLVLTPTNALGLHSLVWRDVWVAEFGGILVLGRDFGPLYWLNTGYNYLLVFGAVYLFAQLAFEANDVGRKQGLALLAASFPPFIANILWIRGLTAIDYTPFAFVLTGIAFGLALYRFRLFEVVPIAHESILDAFRDGYVVVGESGRVLDLNEAARKRMVAHDDPVNEPLSRVLPEVAALLDETGATVANEEIELRRGEDLRYVDVRVSPLGDRPGQLLLLRDVTDRREVERRYRKLIENSSDLITVLDESGTFTYASPAAERVLGRPPEEVVGSDAFEPIHPDDREGVVAEFQQALEDPDYHAAAEYRYRRADGSWVWLSSRGANRFEDPFVDGFVVNSRDVTQRRRRERALERQNERLDEFAGVVSHDLRNPLTVIQGHLDMARETGAGEHFDAMEQAADRMETLTEDLLQLARQGQEVGERESVAIASVAREAWSNVETGTATLACADTLGAVAADPDRLEQLFENLFRNAIEHGGPDVRVTVGELPDGLFVADDGPGIPAEDRSSVFDRGYTTNSDGTGFGLAIVQTIVSAHGWEIEVVEAEGGGARFEITGVDRPAGHETD